MMKTAMYLRQSLDRDNTQIAVDRQRKALLQLCADRDWGDPVEYTDNNFSATKGVRPRYQDLCRDIAKGEVGRVCVWDLDRLHRQPSELEDFILLVESHQVELANVAGRIDLSDPDGRVMARVKGTLAKWEMEQKSKRHKSANRQKAESGRSLLYGCRPFGYERDKAKEKALEEQGIKVKTQFDKVVPHEAKAIRQACQDLLDGASLYSIAQSWNSAGLTSTRAGKTIKDRRLSESTGETVRRRLTGEFTGETVRAILNNPRYAGLMVYRGKILEDVTPTWPAIVERDVWESVHRLLSDPNRFSGRGRSRRYLLSGIALCGLCGRPMHAGHIRVGENKAPGAYYCRRQGCMRISRTMPDTDDVVVGIVTRRLAEPDAKFSLVRPGVDVKALRGEIKDLERQKDEAEADYRTGIINGRLYRQRVDHIDTRLTPLYNRLDSNHLNRDVKKLAGNPHAPSQFDKLPLDRQRRVIDSLVTVTIYPQRQGGRFDRNAIRVAWKHEEEASPETVAGPQQLASGYWDGHKVRTFNPEQLQQVRAMRAAGETFSSLAKHFGVSQSTVRNVTRDMVAAGRPKHERGQHPAFTTEQLDEMRQRRAAGESCKDIAVDFEVHPATIRRYLRGAGSVASPEMVRLLDERREEIRALYAAGESLSVLSRKFDMHHGTVRSLLGDMYATRAKSRGGQPRKLSDEQRERICEMRAAGQTLQAIADKFGVNRQTISNVVRRSTERRTVPSRLSDEQRDEVRQMWAAGESQRVIGAKFGVSQATISLIVHEAH